MKKKIGFVLVVLIAILILLTAAYFGLRYFGNVDLFDRSGWYTDDSGRVYYLDYYGDAVNGFTTVDGKRYYFDSNRDGQMVTGWQEVNGKRFYFRNSGEMTVGWVDIDSQRYFFCEEGYAVTGWRSIDDTKYHFGTDGALSTGWMETDEGKLFLRDDGQISYGWNEIDGNRYYFDKDGHMVTGWFEEQYYLGEEGLTVGWLSLENGCYYFDHEGRAVTGWVHIDGEDYYFDDQKTMQTGWLSYEGDLYYLKEDGTRAVGKVEINGANFYFTSKGKHVLLVNRWNPVPEDYEPQLVELEGFWVAAECRDALLTMMQGCRSSGYYCVINSAFRDIAFQQVLWNNRYNMHIGEGYTHQEATEMTARIVLPPGTSEHHLGLAIDIIGSDGMYDWLSEHCYEYGFILRYPENKTNVTGIIYEPWHFRYVGTELSLELRDLGLTMEEYMSRLTEDASK